MHREYRVILGALISLVALLFSPQAAAAVQRPFIALSESAIYNPATGEVQFKIVFNQKPDFFTTDSEGCRVNSFQYFVVGDSSLPYPSNYDAIIRGEEIHATIDTIRIRNAAPSDLNDPLSGGWGTIRGEVPYTIAGRVLRFLVRLSLITNQSDVQSISYRLETYQFCSLTGFVDSYIRLAPARR